MTPYQAELLETLLAGGKQLLVIGELGTNLPEETHRQLTAHPAVRIVGVSQDVMLDALRDSRQVRVSPSADLMLNLQRTASGAAIHLIRYDFDSERDGTPTLPELTLDVRLPEEISEMVLHSTYGNLHGEMERDGPWTRLHLRDLPLYAIVELTAK